MLKAILGFLDGVYHLEITLYVAQQIAVSALILATRLCLMAKAVFLCSRCVCSCFAGQWDPCNSLREALAMAKQPSNSR